MSVCVCIYVHHTFMHMYICSFVDVYHIKNLIQEVTDMPTFYSSQYIVLYQQSLLYVCEQLGMLSVLGDQLYLGRKRLRNTNIPKGHQSLDLPLASVPFHLTSFLYSRYCLISCLYTDSGLHFMGAAGFCSLTTSSALNIY